jgi:alpha-mannosidase
MPKQKVHLVCNAHLDPVWLWPWEDGLTEAISTFRVAADFADTHPAFVFNHNESLLYAWIEKHEPALFKRIQAHVASGRWHISGGAYLQPDVNNASGESHIRQFLLGLQFFKDKFGKRPTTAYNFDPFGHCNGFPQILSGCGMDSYIFCRPDHGTFDLPVGAFRWQDRSGSEVLTRRSDDHYLTNGKVCEQLDQWLPHYKGEPETMILWGIGNHGGGVSREEYGVLQQYIRKHPEIDFVESTPEAFFASAKRRRKQLPVMTGEFQNSFPGCYTSLSRVKRAHREAESLAASTERMAALAWLGGDTPYPAKSLDVAWKDILFGEFHDILPGSGIPDVEKDSLLCLSHGIELLRRTRYNCLVQVLRGEKASPDGVVPIFIVNPHGFRVRTQVELEYNISNNFWGIQEIILTQDGKRKPYQRIKQQHNVGAEWRVRLAVDVDLAPWQIIRMDGAIKTIKKAPRPRRPRVSRAALAHRGKQFSIAINPKTGLVDSIVPSGQKRSLVKAGAFRPVLFKDLDHAWTCGDPDKLTSSEVWSTAPGWRKPSARFRLATPEEVSTLSPLPRDKWSTSKKTTAQPIRVIEDGDLRRVVEAIFVHEGSFIVRHYVIGKTDDLFQIRDRVFYNHRDHMLKLEIPLGFEAKQSVSETPYCAVTRQQTKMHDDQSNQRWVAVKGNGKYLAICNTGSFGHSFAKNSLCLNVMRSPAYASFAIDPGDYWSDDRFLPRQDQGEHEVVYQVLAGKRFSERQVSEAASVLNVAPYYQTFFPERGAKKRSPLMSGQPMISSSANNVHTVALKKAERGNALIVRLQELDGKETPTRLRIKGCRNAITTVVPAYGLRTLKVTRKAGKAVAKEVNLVEGL